MAQQSYDLVGLGEAARILDVEDSRIARWIEAGRMPPMVAKLRATPVWRRVDVEKLARDGRWTGRAPAERQIVGVAEAAEILGVAAPAISRWRRKGQFPEPRLERRAAGVPWKPGAGLAATPIWESADIEAFAAARAA